MAKSYDVIIDRSSIYYTVQAETEEEAKNKACDMHNKNYPHESNWWIGDVLEIVDD